MTTTTALAPTANPFEPVIQLVTNAVTGRHTKAAYGRTLAVLIDWYQKADASKADAWAIG